MSLYHFTSVLHLPYILAAGFLRPTESNIDIAVANAGPPVVWLLDTPEVGFDHGLGGAMVDKSQIRFTVRSRLAIRWLDWTPAQKMDPVWRDAFLGVAGGLAAAEHWWVVPGAIPREQWIEIRDMHTGEVIDDVQ